MVIERKERVNVIDVLTFAFVELAIQQLHADNLLIVMNKCIPDEDTPETVLAFYDEARQQIKESTLPNLTSDQIVVLYKQKIGKKN